ncbi:MAG: hypothetical protein ABI220_00190 [Candidatus Saccharimonadales bacterium]
MKPLYHLGKKSRHHRIIEVVIGLLLLIAIIFGVYKLLNLSISPAENITNPPPVTKAFVPDSAPQKHIDEPLFTVDLPNDWSLKSHVTTTYNVYKFQGSKPATRLMSIYIDGLPPKFAVNRLLPVQAIGNRLDHGTVSDNCLDFVSPSAVNTQQSQQTKIVDAKWQNAEFYCDIGNYERDVIGTSSTEAINQVTLTGSSSKHTLFFAYTDNGINPNYSIFYGILESFRLK